MNTTPPLSLPVHSAPDALGGASGETAVAPLRAFLALSPVRGRVLVPACGEGAEVRLLAAGGASVVGLDEPSPALARARVLPRVGTADFREGRWPHAPLAIGGHFDWVVDCACFRRLPPALRLRYLDEVDRALTAGGRFFALFLLGPREEAGAPYGILPDELATLFARFDLLGKWHAAGTDPRSGGREEVRLYRKA
ncbi:MAG: methyltransferase domain-containing protein [Opitutales bacterium]